jgi:PAS domain S-box-containing protein
MMLIKFKNRQCTHLCIVLIIAIVLTMFSISVSLIDRIYNFFAMFSTLPIAEFLINVGFLTLMGLLWLTYRRWREASEKRVELANIIDSISPDVLLVVDPFRNITMCNRSIGRMYGYCVNEVVNQKTDILYFDRRSGSKKRCQIFETLEEEGFHIGLAVGKKKNGETIPLEIITGSLSEGDGAVMLLRDITERKRAEEALRESEEKYRTLVEHANDGIAIIQDGQLKYVNNRLGEMTGYAVEQLTGRQVVECIYPDERDKVVQYHKRRMAGEKVPDRYESALKHKDGSKIDVEFNATIINYEERPAVLALIRDITKRIEAQEERKRLETQLQQAQKLESIGTLAGGIAHDFNNLLTGIQGNASLMLLDVDFAHPLYQRLKDIEKQVQSGARLTSLLLGYARKGKYQVRPFSLNELVEEISHTFGRTRKEITVHRHLSDDLYAIQGDYGQIEQVLLNLCVNAADAMPAGGDIIIRTMNATDRDMMSKLYKPKPGKYVLLTVADTGSGMDRKTTERIFEPFFTTKEMGRGTGLGLASVYGTIKAHHGYIDVESKQGSGTTFSIYLPACEKEVSNTVKPADRIVKGAETVLLADDEEFVRQVSERLLESLGYQVLLARDGKEAVELYKKKREDIDLVLLDIVMPNMGGSEAYDRMKEVNPDIKVLLLSGHTLDAQATDMLERGCDAFIQKPFNMNKLSGKIREVLDKN